MHLHTSEGEKLHTLIKYGAETQLRWKPNVCPTLITSQRGVGCLGVHLRGLAESAACCH